jgi:hypothetical protein
MTQPRFYALFTTGLIHLSETLPIMIADLATKKNAACGRTWIRFVKVKGWNRHADGPVSPPSFSR